MYIPTDSTTVVDFPFSPSLSSGTPPNLPSAPFYSSAVVCTDNGEQGGGVATLYSSKQSHPLRSLRVDLLPARKVPTPVAAAFRALTAIGRRGFGLAAVEVELN